MKKIVTLSTLIGAAVILAGCATNAPVGMLYSGETLPVTATSNATGMKTGQACSTSILALVATGDSSIAAAKVNGGISQVSSVDWNVSNFMGIYGEYCTVVHGN
ncbi:MAG: TRL-like protein family [Gammaproteobacteria bacterium]|nr:TRL-like protein family [Gammaproteobacteria bacterium]